MESRESQADELSADQWTIPCSCSNIRVFVNIQSKGDHKSGETIASSKHDACASTKQWRLTVPKFICWVRLMESLKTHPKQPVGTRRRRLRWNFLHLFIVVPWNAYGYRQNWCLLACNLSPILQTFTGSNGQEKERELSFKLCLPPFWFIISFRSLHLFCRLRFFAFLVSIVDTAICWCLLLLLFCDSLSQMCFSTFEALTTSTVRSYKRCDSWA